MEFNLNDFIWATINFGAFILILWIFLYKPVLGMMIKRTEEIENNLSRAEAANREAEQLRQKHLADVQNARKEAQDILNQATRSASEAKEQILAEARQQANELLEKAQTAIEREKHKAIAELREEVATLAVMAAGKIIKRELKAEDHGRLVNEFVSQVGGQ